MNLSTKTEDKKKSKPQTKNESLSFVDRISSVLLCLSAGKSTVKDVAQWCNLNISTTHRLLNLLKDPGFTLYDPHSHRYYVGPLINQLASNPDTAHQFIMISSQMELERLAELTHETVNMSCLFGLRLEPLLEIPSKHGLKVFISEDDENGRHKLTPFAATEKALMTQLSKERLRKVLNSIRILSDPLIDIEELETEIDQVREKGFCISNGVRVPDAIGISAPVPGYTCPLALTILGPDTRMKNRISEFTSLLLNSVNQMANNIKEYFRSCSPPD